ncbi:MAG: L-seryl-tRNA(Sec) selenium transferase [Coriobacteriia bacterium]|nr:L-seryl-tRNA(Sec) selenium transferase [Coriobacteriia bacterium]
MSTQKSTQNSTHTQSELYRALPNMDDMLDDARVVQASHTYGRTVVLDMLRARLDEVRSAITLGTVTTTVDAPKLIDTALATLALREMSTLRRVINATGIVVHTNLGRSVLADEALEAVAEVAGGYSTLEYNVEAGERGSRHDHIERLLCELTGAEAGIAVNNNAAAVLLALTCFAKGKEVVVSRGQLVEIGGSFRIPDICAQSGARMVEVGTTNKTHVADYGKAFGSKTGLILKVHTSNFDIVGFAETPTTFELAQLGAQYDVPLLEDQGSGVLIDLKPFGLPYEPTVTEALFSGASLVTFSGDKLLGGPQAGLIVGSRWAIDTLKQHPLVRALRLDKMTIAALEATLKLYRDHDLARARIPTLRMLTMRIEESRERAEMLRGMLESALGDRLTCEVVEDVAYAGGGSLPMADLPSFVVRVRAAKLSARELEERLRDGDTTGPATAPQNPATPPIVARVRDGYVLLDPRTFVRDDAEIVVETLSRIVA